jgi:hypothetical protein
MAVLATKEPSIKRKQKVTLSVDTEIWRKFITKIIWETGRQKEASRVIEKLLLNYLEEKKTGKTSDKQTD